jgi:hypothetical protein
LYTDLMDVRQVEPLGSEGQNPGVPLSLDSQERSGLAPSSSDIEFFAPNPSQYPVSQHYNLPNPRFRSNSTHIFNRHRPDSPFSGPHGTQRRQAMLNTMGAHISAHIPASPLLIIQQHYRLLLLLYLILFNHRLGENLFHLWLGLIILVLMIV